MRACAILLATALSATAQNAPPDLLESARSGRAKDVEALLAKGADLEVRDRDGRTPLMLAAQYGRTAVVRSLLAKGAKPDARDTHGWNAYMLALLSPAGGMIHSTHDAVLKLLPQPKRFRLAFNAGWTPGKSMFSSCFLRPEDLREHLRQIRPDALVIEAFQRFTVTSGRDLIAIVQSDALGTSEVPNKTPPQDIDATLFLMVEPGAACVQQSDQLNMLIQATLTRPDEAAPMLAKAFSAGVKTGMRGEVATNANQYGPIYAAWAKSRVKELYWEVVTALLEQH